MSAIQIKGHFINIDTAIEKLHEKSDSLEGLVILECTKDGDYDFYVAGTVSAERTIGRLEVVKQAFLRKIGA